VPVYTASLLDDSVIVDVGLGGHLPPAVRSRRFITIGGEKPILADMDAFEEF
jgi:hypothetical protein